MKAYLAFAIVVILILVLGWLVSYKPYQRSISGRISYDGAFYPGRTIVTSTWVSNDRQFGFTKQVFRNVGDYTVKAMTGYFTLSAFLDRDYDDEQDPDEPFGFYDADGDGRPDEVSVRGIVTGIDFALLDP